MKKTGLLALWDWYGTFAFLAGQGDSNDKPCASPSSRCFDQSANSASLPPIDSYNVWPYLAGQTSRSPRTELPLAAPNNEEGRPPNPWAGTQINVNGLIVTEGDIIWKLLTHEIPQSHWTGPRFPNRTSETLGRTDIKGTGNTCGGTYPAGETFPGCGDGYTWCGDGCLFRLDVDPEERENLAAENPAQLEQMRVRVQVLAAYVMSTGMKYNDIYLANGGAGAAPVTSCTGNCGFRGDACHTALTKYQNFWGPFVDADSITGEGPWQCDEDHACQVAPDDPCPDNSLATSRCSGARLASIGDCLVCYQQYFAGCSQADEFCSSTPVDPATNTDSDGVCPSSTWPNRAAEVEAACCPDDNAASGHRRLQGDSGCTIPSVCEGRCPQEIVRLHSECPQLEAVLNFMENSQYTQLLARCEEAASGTDDPYCTSVSDCAALGWPLEDETDDLVCAASEQLSSDYCSRGTYREAAMICQGAHARLCTLDELEADQAAGTGCGFDTQIVWTHSVGTCEAGSHMTAAGASREWDTNGPVCTSDDTSAGVRCCADASAYATTHCDSICTSPMTCEELADFHMGTTEDVCGASQVPECGSSDNWRHAAAVCAAIGARLCTLSEIEAGEVAGTGCSFDSQRTWSKDIGDCPEGQHKSAAGNANSWTDVPPECSEDSADHKIRCCADAMVGTACEVPCTSSSSCEQLGWSTSTDGVESADHICGAVAPGCPVFAFSEAEATCLELGSRLCTIEEVASNEVRGTGCGFDSVPIWSNTVGACGAGSHITAAGDPRNWDEFGPTCTDDANVAAVRCCADEVADILACSEVTDQVLNTCVSPLGCETLGWELEDGDDEVCADSTGLGCQSLSYSDAETYCVSAGARLCTLDEIGANEAAGTGCGFDNQRTWTMTTDGCADGQSLSAAGKAFFWSTVGPVCTDTVTVLGVRCCADSSTSTRREAGVEPCV